MKRTSARAFYCLPVILVCMLVCIGQRAKADNWVGFQLSDYERIMAYYENGDILCSVLNEERELTAIKQLSYESDTLWQHDFDEPFVNGSVLFKAKDDGTGYTIAGKVHSSDEQYKVYLIGSDGQIQTTGLLSTQYVLRAVTDNGLVYSSAYDEANGKQEIFYTGWDGSQGQGAFFGKIIFVQRALSNGGTVYLDMVYDRQDGQRMSAILILDLEDGTLLCHDIGEYTRWTAQAIGRSADDAVTAVFYDHKQQLQMALCLNPAGELKWRTELYSNLYYPTAQIIRQNREGNHEIFGIAGVLEAGETYPQITTTYKTTLSEDGQLISDALGTYAGDCVEYRENEVYVLDIDDMNYASLDIFQINSRISKRLFNSK